MLNETFANVVLGAMFGRGQLYDYSVTSTTQSSTITVTPSYKDITGGLGAHCYIGLLTDWDDKGTLETVQEYTDENYERIELGRTETVYTRSGNSVKAELKTTSLMNPPAGGEISNKDFIKFNPLADGASGVSFKGFALYTAATGGTAMYAAALKEPLTGVSAGDVPVFHKGELKVTFGKDGENTAAAAASLSAE